MLTATALFPAVVALAQDTEEARRPPLPPPPSPAAQGTGGQPATFAAQAAAGWEPRCTSAGRTAPADCTLEQRLVVQETGQPFLTLTVRVPVEPRQPFLLVQLPLGLHLPSGLVLQVDAGEVQRVAIERCDPNGCYAGGPLAGDLLAAMNAGRMLNVTLRTADGQDLGLAVPLAGFTPGYAAIQ